VRKIIVVNLMSLDSRFEGPDGSIASFWQNYNEEYEGDDSFHYWMLEHYRNAGTMIWGGKTFREFKDFWASVGSDPNATPLFREMAQLMNQMEMVVVSDTITEGELAPWSDAQIVRGTEIAEKVGALKAKEGRDILIIASHKLWNSLLEMGLIDELHVTIGNVITGEGTRTFYGQPNVKLRLLETRTNPGSGNVIIHYAVRKA
jgi:dihydrofolate reductase